MTMSAHLAHAQPAIHAFLPVGHPKSPPACSRVGKLAPDWNPIKRRLGKIGAVNIIGGKLGKIT